MTNDNLIEEAAKALTGLTDAEWEIATAEGTEHLTGYFEAAARCLDVFEKAHAKELDTSTEPVKNGDDSLHVAPTDDQRGTWESDLKERLDIIGILEREDDDEKHPADFYDDAARALQAAGFRRSEVSEPSEDHMGALARIDQAIAYIRASWLGNGEPTRNTPAGEIIAILRGVRTFEPEAQGEPSDARIRQAVLDGLADASVLQSPFQPQMRELVAEQITLALRAAGGVR